MSDEPLQIELHSKASTEGLIALLESTIAGIKPRQDKCFRIHLRITEEKAKVMKSE